MFGPERFFYHGLLRDVVVLFGDLFNNLYINRSEQNGLTSLMKVPLAYGPKSKWLARIEMDPSGEVQTNNVILPRMSFEITGMNYDPLRRINGQEKASVSGVENLRSSYDAIPYNIHITLSVLARNSEDAVQIVEQIIPNFSPEFTLVYEKDFKTFTAPVRIPIVLENVQNQDEYEGDFKTRRAIVWTLEFIAKTVIVSDIKNSSIILNTNVNNLYNSGVFSGKDFPPGTEDFFANMNISASGSPTASDIAGSYGVTYSSTGPYDTIQTKSPGSVSIEGDQTGTFDQSMTGKNISGNTGNGYIRMEVITGGDGNVTVVDGSPV